MGEKSGNLELIISTGAPDNQAIAVKMISHKKPPKYYVKEIQGGFNLRKIVVFADLPLGFYDVEISTRGSVIKKELVHVKFPGEDTHWNDHFRHSRNTKTCVLSGLDSLTDNSATINKMSSMGMDLLGSFEELRLRPYDDQTGKVIFSWIKGATIGYGHLISQGEWNKYKDGITEVQAKTLFRLDLSDYIDAVNSNVKIKLGQHQFDALVMLTFNIGINAFKSSSVLKMVNDPAVKTGYSTLESAWKAWTKSQGQVMLGLVNRRQAEWDIYSKNLYKKW
jgi:type VI secretion system secreted protein VgrG